MPIPPEIIRNQDRKHSGKHSTIMSIQDWSLKNLLNIFWTFWCRRGRGFINPGLTLLLIIITITILLIPVLMFTTTVFLPSKAQLFYVWDLKGWQGWSSKKKSLKDSLGWFSPTIQKLVLPKKRTLAFLSTLQHIDLGGLDVQHLVTCYRPAPYAFAIWGVIYMMDAWPAVVLRADWLGWDLSAIRLTGFLTEVSVDEWIEFGSIYFGWLSLQFFVQGL